MILKKHTVNLSKYIMGAEEIKEEGHFNVPERNTTTTVYTTDEVKEEHPNTTRMNALQILARKHNLDEARPVPMKKTIGAFIHVGKTGGSSLSEQLRYGCHSFVPKPCSRRTGQIIHNVVSNLTTYVHVPDFSYGKNGLFGKSYLYNFYLFTVRDPLDRTISAFLYQHPLNVFAETSFGEVKRNMEPQMLKELRSVHASDKAMVRAIFDNLKEDEKRIAQKAFGKNYKAYSCFDTLEDFAMLLRNPDKFEYSSDWEEMVKNRKCSDFAKMCMKGLVNNALQHIRFNLATITWNIGVGLTRYQPNFNSTLSKTSNTKSTSGAIFTVRSHNLVEDWISVNEYLGQDRRTITYPEKKIRDSSAVTRPVSNDLSEEGRKSLCLALKREYDVYLSLIHSSENLSEKDMQDSLDLAKKKLR